MNILVIRETNPFATSNAPNNRFLTLAEGLVENGCKIEMLFINGFYSKEERTKFQNSGSFKKINYTYLLPVDYSVFIVRQFYLRIFPLFYTLQKIEKIISERKCDIIWLDFGPKVVKIGLNLFKAKIPVKYFHERSEFSWIGLSGNNKIHEKYLNYFLPHIDALSVMTGTLFAYYKDFIGDRDKIIHLPMTVDFSRFSKVDTDNQLVNPYVAYCGTMSNSKDGVDVLIQSFIEISREFPKLHLYIAGPLIPEQDYLSQKAIIEESKMENRITYLGSLTRDEMPTFLANATVLALARPESKQAEGGFPTKLGEYLATGKPVCCTRVGEIINYLTDEETAFIAEPNSVDSFANALKRSLTSKVARSIGESGKNIALVNFNKEIQSKYLHNFLLKTIQ